MDRLVIYNLPLVVLANVHNITLPHVASEGTVFEYFSLCVPLWLYKWALSYPTEQPAGYWQRREDQHEIKLFKKQLSGLVQPPTLWTDFKDARYPPPKSLTALELLPVESVPASLPTIMIWLANSPHGSLPGDLAGALSQTLHLNYSP